MKSILLQVCLLSTSVVAQQADAAWALRQPQNGGNMLLGTHPVTGRLLRWDQAANVNPGFDATLSWELVGSEWVRIVDSARPVRSSAATLLLDAVRGELMVFTVPPGAVAEQTSLWNGREWRSWPHPALFAPRANFAAACDLARGRVVLFGGVIGTTALNDTWEWDGDQWQLRQLGAPPAPRSQHAMAYDAARQRIVMFGGRDQSGAVLNDTWEYDGSFWTRRQLAVAPRAQQQHAMVYVPSLQRCVLAGGRTALTSPVAETWEWDGNGWTLAATAGPTLPSASISILQPALIRYDAGRSQLIWYLPDTDEIWAYTGTGWQFVGALLPQGRLRANLVYDDQRQQVLLHGGGNGAAASADTWLWDGSTWQRPGLSIAPPARWGAAMGFHRSRGEALLFGGATTTSNPTVTTYRNDSWLWDGAGWRQATTSSVPSVRSGAAIAYHDASQRLVLFGGETANAMLDDTWTFDGLDWSRLQPAHAPSPRSRASMTASPQGLVLFGGTARATPSWVRNAETWIWDGVDWLQVQTTQSPPASSQSGLAYDPARQRVLLLGGDRDGTSSGSEATWSFDGSDWAMLPTAAAPGPTPAPSMVWDAARSELLMLAAFTASNRLYTELWALGEASLASRFGQGCAGSLGVPQLAPIVSNSARLGGTLRTEVTALPQSFAVVTMGFSDQSAGSQQLPWSLAGLGMPGCSLYVAPDASLLMVGSQQRAEWSLPLPYSAGFAGLRFFAQAIVLDPGVNVAGATVSNAIAVQIGS